MQNINWGIIGCGNVTEKKSGPAFNKVTGSQLVAVMRRDAEKAADYASRHNVGKWYNNADEVFNDPEINAIYIATPPSSHLEYTLAALQKGMAVYVEKPVAMNAAEAQHMAEAARTYGGKLVVAHYRRRLPMFLKVKELLDNKAIGDVRTIQMRLWQSRKPALVTKDAPNWRTDPNISGGGYFHDLAPHQLDLMLYFFGQPLRYQGFSLNQSGDTPADDHVTGSILFANNTVFNGSWCFNVAENENMDRCEIIGSEGSISFAVFGTSVTVKVGPREEVFEFEHPENIQHPMISSVVGYLNGEEANPCTIDEAITLMKIIDTFTTN
ncbi:Gfo/Idh/MocA family oxidoreductase [Mucilaginibacter daejeonensis]|uniref:Gfo/Idh/MocA family protein n=1 Tax=Mucilaginibacter daejeonensis TaxID=398049 RepID=UPI001D176CAC|nr:Gfo/Idh/MocA family oxidoreductase [Mucilaginibacter daejeonensis]UEG52385.1 Gfo/Idh/MocA family oxidoreductase [Mucilaginibacter daejeonensis]